MTQPRLTVARAKLLRRPMSKPEVHLWCSLRAGGLDGFDFRKQHPIGPYILDFFCGAAKLAVEVDGSQHLTEEQFAHDQRRDAWLSRQGVGVTRFAAGWVLGDTVAVLEEISLAAQARMWLLHGRDLRR